MKVYIIDNGSYYVDAIKCLLPVGDIETRALGSLDLKDVDANSLIILSGGHITPVLWHQKEYAKEIEIIEKHAGPIIGICLGSELIAHVFGAHLHTMANGRKGLIDIRESVVENDIVRNNETFTVFENHHLVVQKVNRPLIAIAKSKDGIEIFKHEERPIYGIQFHPEVTTTGHQGGLLFGRILKEVMH